MWMFKLGRLWMLFRKELMLVLTMLRDPRTPGISKLMAVLAAVYIVSPIDFIPDFIPILGWIDDGLITVLLIKLAMKFLPPELLASLQAKVDKKTNTVNV